MKKWIALLATSALTLNSLSAQSLFSDSVLLKAVEVHSSRTIDDSPATNRKVLDSAMLSNPSSGNLGKVLAENSGIFVKTYGQGALASVSFRGSGASHTGVYWNGFSLNSAMNGMVDLSLLPIAFYDQVEIDYGNSSLEKGAGGLGGSINLRSLPDFNNRLSLEVHQSVGSFGHIGTFGKVGFGNEKWQSVSKIYRQSAMNDFEYENLGKESFPIEKQENARVKQEGLLQSIYFRPNSKNLIKLEAWYLNSDRQIPSIMTVGDKEEVQKDEAVRLLLSGKRYLKSGSIELASNYQHEFLDYSNKMLEQHSKTSTENWKNQLKSEYEFSSKFKMHGKLSMDLELMDNKTFEKERNQWRQSAYLAAQYTLKKFELELFAREEWLKDRDVYLLPGAAVSYFLDETKKWKVSSSIAKNMKYPTLNDLYWLPAGNPNLKSEESTNMEVQLNHSNAIFLQKLSYAFSLTAFRYDIANYIQWQPTAFGYWRAKNLKEIQSKGVELDGQLKYMAGRSTISLRGSYSYTSSINTKPLNEQVNDGSVGKQLFYVPKHLWNLHLELKQDDYWLKLTQQYTGLRYTTSDNSDFISAFSLLGIRIGKAWTHGNHRISVELAVENILDKEYQAIQWRPMPGRNYMVSIKYGFVK